VTSSEKLKQVGDLLASARSGGGAASNDKQSALDVAVKSVAVEETVGRRRDVDMARRSGSS